MKQCPYCGNSILDDAKFCVECGKSLVEDAPAVEAAPAEAPEIPVPEQKPKAPAPEQKPEAPAAEGTVRCVFCGSEMSRDSQVCPNCGKKR